MYSGVMQNIAGDHKPAAAAAAAAVEVSGVIDRQTSYRAANSSTPGVDDALDECEMLSMPECQPPEPDMRADTVHADHGQNCNNGGTLCSLWILCVLLYLLGLHNHPGKLYFRSCWGLFADIITLNCDQCLLSPPSEWQRHCFRLICVCVQQTCQSD